jgi:hypothetical protein
MAYVPATPTMAAPTWEPASLLPADYTAQPGGPTLAELNASPLWRMIQSTAAGAPSASLPKDWQSLVPQILSGSVPLNPPAFDPATMPAPPSWSTYIAPTPGQPGWVDPVWGSGALPMDQAPPNPFSAAPAAPGATPTPKDPPMGFNPRGGGSFAGGFAGGRWGGSSGGGMGGERQMAPQTPQAPQPQQPQGWGQQWGGFGGNSGGQQQPGEQQSNPFSFGKSPWRSW